MTNEEAFAVIECMLTNIAGDYAGEEMQKSIKRKFEALEKAEKALKEQIKLKVWISAFEEHESFFLVDRKDLITILKEFEVEDDSTRN